MDSDFSQIKFKKKTNWYELKENFLKFEEIQVCDCFIDSTINF